MGEMNQANELFPQDEIVRLETNLDDCTGECLGYAMECLLAAGARDVFYTPVFTKKNRPAYLLTVLCKEEDRQKLEEIIFMETTSIGIRRKRSKEASCRAKRSHWIRSSVRSQQKNAGSGMKSGSIRSMRESVRSAGKKIFPIRMSCWQQRLRSTTL